MLRPIRFLPSKSAVIPVFSEAHFLAHNSCPDDAMGLDGVHCLSGKRQYEFPDLSLLSNTGLADRERDEWPVIVRR